MSSNSYVKELMINEYKLKEMGCDFMGYTLSRRDILTYHHLIVPRRHGGPSSVQNGAIIQRVPHDYLHLLERVSPETFYIVTSEMIDMNIKGYLDPFNLGNIHEALCEFEYKHAGEHTKKGKILITEEYTRGRLLDRR